ncbi:unnamed protein product [Heligmosomoides polygyrus]|uniref:Uncharacterized protein n=1 Tax=Heligmosomoides polygyrus TaxID=6339 RepID=A0A183FYZ0_HELPZ|nr:unnamed protein product [Heligmosomoides polygyrus]
MTSPNATASFRAEVATQLLSYKRTDSWLKSIITGESDIACTSTSRGADTGLTRPMNRFTSTGHRNRHHISDVFANTAATLPSPITFSSDNVMTTPAMLGLRKQKHR